MKTRKNRSKLGNHAGYSRGIIKEGRSESTTTGKTTGGNVWHCEKTVGLATIVKDALSPLANRIQLAFVFGSMASGKQHAHSDLDICILGGLELFEVVKALDSVQETLQREINPVVMSSNRFIDQLANHDRFAERIFDELKVYVIGDDDEFAKLAQQQ